MNFYKILSTYYDIIFPFTGSKEMFFLDFVQEAKPGRVLDLGSATGALVGMLTRLGWTAVGVDLSSDLVRLARSLHPGTFLEEDMLGFLARSEREYDLIVCIGNTLPHLPKEHLKKFLDLAATHLNPGGKIIIQTVNYHKILKHKPPNISAIERPEEGVTFTRLYDYNSDGSIRFTAVLESPEGKEKSAVTLWPITHQDFKDMLPHQLRTESEYGSFAREPFRPEESPAWVAVAIKQ